MQRVLGLTRESQIFLPPSPPSAGFRGCEGGSGERKIEKVQSAQALHFASEFRGELSRGRRSNGDRKYAGQLV
jgi:hypothetical protein